MFLAQDEATGGSMLPLLMIVLLFAVMYFLLIRPQQKRRQEAMRMQSQVGVGDEIVTVGGLYGTITSLDDETITLEVSPGVHARYARSAIGRVVNSVQQDSDSIVDHGDNKD